MVIKRSVTITTVANFEFWIEYVSESKPDGPWVLILNCHPNVGFVAPKLGLSENRLKKAAEDAARLLGAALVGISPEAFTGAEYGYPGPYVMLKTENPDFNAETIKANWKKLEEALEVQ